MDDVSRKAAIDEQYTRRAMMGEQQWQHEQSRTIHGSIGNGVTYSVGEVSDTSITIIERIDLTNPDCPVVCFNKDGVFIERRYPMSAMEYRQKFGQLEQPSQPSQDHRPKP